MKLDVSATRTLPPELLAALNSPRTADAFQRRVVAHCLNVNPSTIGPADYFIQEARMIVPASDENWGIEVVASGVPANIDRIADLYEALDAIRKIYTNLIETHISHNKTVQLKCILIFANPIQHLDGHLKMVIESRIELVATVVFGKKDN